MNSNPPDRGSITRILDRGLDLRESQTRIFNRYFEALERLASERLGTNRQVEDGEDIAIKTLAELFEMARDGYLKSKKVDNRKKLAGLLRQITTRRAINEVRKQNTIKRGGGTVIHETDLGKSSDSDYFLSQFDKGLVELSDIDDSELEGELQQIVESIADRFSGRARTIVSLRLLGLSNREIAADLGVSTRTIEREVESKIKPVLSKHS